MYELSKQLLPTKHKFFAVVMIMDNTSSAIANIINIMKGSPSVIFLGTTPYKDQLVQKLKPPTIITGRIILANKKKKLSENIGSVVQRLLAFIKRYF